MFTIVDAGGGRIGLRASNGRYVSADPSLSSYLVAHRTSFQGWEMFTWIDAGTGKVQLRANANNMYVSADVNLRFWWINLQNLGTFLAQTQLQTFPAFRKVKVANKSI
jgi:hypothetical protein